MNDHDYIRKAVELADGWSWQDNSIFFTRQTLIFSPDITFKVPLNELGKDALAAQLVRQVDALDGCLELVVFEGETNIMDQANTVGCGLGDDRTMNSIKAIVDSGVLEQSNG